MFRALVVAKHQREDRLELATFQAYETVRIRLMVKHKRSGKRVTATMPKWDDVIRRDGGARSFRVGDSHDKGRAFLQLVAAETGGVVRRVKRR